MPACWRPQVTSCERPSLDFAAIAVGDGSFAIELRGTGRRARRPSEDAAELAGICIEHSIPAQNVSTRICRGLTSTS